MWPRTASWSEAAGVSSAVGTGPTCSAAGGRSVADGGGGTGWLRGSAGGAAVPAGLGAPLDCDGGGAVGGADVWATADAPHPTAPTASVAISRARTALRRAPHEADRGRISGRGRLAGVAGARPAARVAAIARHTLLVAGGDRLVGAAALRADAVGARTRVYA